jgi:hypothetical protein
MTEETHSYNTTPMVDYDTDLSLLAQFRQTEADAMQTLKQLRAALEDNPLYKEQMDRLREAQTCSDEIEKRIKEYALASYQESQDKHPHPAVNIRLETILEYDKPIAIAWCEHNMPQALKLDYQLFEKHVRAVADTNPLGFVTVAKIPKAAIASDLSAYLPPADPTPIDLDFGQVEPIPI